jgi:hypothetical protein
MLSSRTQPNRSTASTTTLERESTLDTSRPLADPFEEIVFTVDGSTGTSSGGDARSVIESNSMTDQDAYADDITVRAEHQAVRPPSDSGSGATRPPEPEPDYPLDTGVDWTDYRSLPPTTYDMYQLEDGSIVAMDDDGDVVAVLMEPVEYPDTLGHVWDGEAVREVQELEDGTIVVVDENGNPIGELDSFDPTLSSGNPALGEVELVPLGPPSYDTLAVDPDTGEILGGYNTGGMNTSAGAIAANDGYPTQTYRPIGEDVVYHIDPRTGEVVDVVEIEPEPSWSILGIVSGGNGTGFSWNLGITSGNVTINEDGFSAEVGVGIDGVLEGEVNVDIGGGEVSFGASGEIYGVGSGSVGFEYEDSGNWSFAAEGEVGLPGLGTVGAGLSFGQEDGLAYAHAHGSADVQLGLLDVSGSISADFQQTEDGFVVGAAMDGQVGAFGAYLERESSIELAVDDDGFELTYTDRIAAGHDLVGEVGVGGAVSGGVDDGEAIGGVAGTVDAESRHLGRAEAGVTVDSEDGVDTHAEAEGRNEGRADADEADADLGSSADLFPTIRPTRSAETTTSPTATPTTGAGSPAAAVGGGDGASTDGRVRDWIQQRAAEQELTRAEAVERFQAQRSDEPDRFDRPESGDRLDPALRPEQVEDLPEEPRPLRLDRLTEDDRVVEFRPLTEAPRIERVGAGDETAAVAVDDTAADAGEDPVVDLTDDLTAAPVVVPQPDAERITADLEPSLPSALEAHDLEAPDLEAPAGRLADLTGVGPNLGAPVVASVVAPAAAPAAAAPVGLEPADDVTWVDAATSGTDVAMEDVVFTTPEPEPEQEPTADADPLVDDPVDG